MNVRTMTADDEASAIGTIVLSFVADPATRWTWPGADQFLAAMPPFVRAFGSRAYAHEGAFCSSDYTGVAL